jgi:AcrR family transcriptional regulator
MPNLRERKKDRTRRRLLDVADALFRRKGYEAATLEEICEKAEISTRTFFRYFESKRDLALYENIRNLGRLREMLAPADPDGDVLGELRRLYVDMAAEMATDARAFQRVALMSREPSLAARAVLLDLDSERRIARALMAQHGAETRLEAQLVATLIVGGVRAQLLHCLALADPAPLPRHVDEVFARLARCGLLPVRRRSAAKNDPSVEKSL